MSLLPGCGEGAAERAVATALGDSEARFQAVRDRGDFVCGEVNGAEQRRGYSRFVFDEGVGAAFIDPGLTNVHVATTSPDPACRKPDAYQSVDERLNCAAAPALERDAQRQLAFDRLWEQACA